LLPRFFILIKYIHLYKNGVCHARPALCSTVLWTS
jgi:hypothetical protein